MAEVEEIFARVRADFEKSLRDEAKAQDSLTKASADAARLRAALEVLGEYVANPAKSQPRESGVAREGSKAKAIVDIAIFVIKSKGPSFGPLLMDAVVAGGVNLGNNPKQQFASAMSRDPRVVFERETGWRLVSSPDVDKTSDFGQLLGESDVLSPSEGGAYGTTLASH